MMHDDSAAEKRETLYFAEHDLQKFRLFIYIVINNNIT